MCFSKKWEALNGFEPYAPQNQDHVWKEGLIQGSTNSVTFTGNPSLPKRVELIAFERLFLKQHYYVVEGQSPLAPAIHPRAKALFS